METNNKLAVFSNPDFGEVRTLEINGEPWFVGKDIAVALGYTNPQKAVREHVDDEDRTVNESFTVNGTAMPEMLLQSTLMKKIKLPSRFATPAKAEI